MKYLFRFKRRFVWRSRSVIGHRYEQNIDKMVLYFDDGGLEEIGGWSYCDLRLGPDWALAVQKDLEKKAGQAVPVNRETDATS